MIFFKKTKISEIIILLLVGLMIGPIFGIIGKEALVSFESIMPYFAGFALSLILFEGGMYLNFFKTLKSIGGSFVFTMIIFSLTVIFVGGVVAAVSYFGFLEFGILPALLLGVILGGTSSAIVIPLVSSTSASDETKMLLSLESALTDAVCVVVAMAIGELILAQTINLTNISSSIIGAFSIAAIMGLIFGLIWLKILTHLKGKPYEYLMTFGAVLFLYSITSILKGNGAIAVLLFGIVLGNSEDITNMLRLQTTSVDNTIKNFQKEISFLVRTFFFVYLGILFKLEYLTIPIIVISILIVGLIIVARIIGTKLLEKASGNFKKDSILLKTLNARGLAAAVLVSLPVSLGLGFSNVLLNQINAIVFIVILLSNVTTTIGVFLAEKEYKKQEIIEGQKPGKKIVIQ